MRGEQEKREMHLYTTEQNKDFVHIRGGCQKWSSMIS